jgi:hypothetical protein
MKSLPSVSKNDFAAPGVSEETDPMEDGLRLLAKFMASAIRRANGAQNFLPSEAIINPQPT